VNQKSYENKKGKVFCTVYLRQSIYDMTMQYNINKVR